MSMLQNEFTVEGLKEAFLEKYGKSGEDVCVYSSPARINIIGEHIDYNGGKVFPCAINRYLYLALRKRADDKIIYNDLRFEGSFCFSVNDNFVYDKKIDYANYLNGIIKQLRERGLNFDRGFEVLIASNVPAGGGISSSSALECGFAWAVNDMYGFNLTRTEVAVLGQMSEHRFMNVNCGIMDQFVIANGKKESAIKLDCATLEYEYVPLKLGEYSFIVMNTNKARKLADSKYNERRSQCEKALKILQDGGIKIQALCDLSASQWEECKNLIKDDVIQRRARHCILENQRVLEAVNCLKNNDLCRLGVLLNQSHKSLKEDYEVTGIELDTLAEFAQIQEGCLGARMTGAGFGGCAIALVRTELIEEFVKKVQDNYKKTVGWEASFFACQSGDGVKKV